VGGTPVKSHVQRLQVGVPAAQHQAQRDEVLVPSIRLLRTGLEGLVEGLVEVGLLKPHPATLRVLGGTKRAPVLDLIRPKDSDLSEMGENLSGVSIGPAPHRVLVINEDWWSVCGLGFDGIDT